MTERWAENQVTALAPDANSLIAARELAGRWSNTGWQDSALWGLCTGSGSRPYRTVVDLTGPAYHCSCPSRKLPCKHALSLLLHWSAGGIDPAAHPADFADEWLRRRAGKNARSPHRPPTTNPATVEQRRMRVRAGLDELETWITDSIRTGLADTDRSYVAFEAVAARMVDAQAPGIAADLRRLPTAVVGRTDWPEVVMSRFARLHLLITAHRRLDELPEPLAASVRGHIGYPVPVDAVLREPGTPDRWLAVGVRMSEEGGLHTRRTWLYGCHTDRWGLIVEHSYGAPTFSPEVPPLGAATEAKLHHYPGAAPLRAVLGERYGPPKTVAAGSADLTRHTVAAALDRYAAALGADPWLDSWPVLLHEVVPTRGADGWYLAESDGTALPVDPSAQQWRLPAISGGYPITVCAEWNGRYLAPISVLAEGEILDAGPVVRAEPPAATATELVSAALLGTARCSSADHDLPEPVATTAAALADREAAVRLLEITALQNVYARAGATAAVVEPAGDIAATDPRPILPRPAGRRLMRLLRHEQEYLPEWFAAAERHGYRAPDRLCGDLLDHAHASEELREPALRLAGARGRWLAARFPEWKALVRRDPTADPIIDDGRWHGLPIERREWLSAARRRDPDFARSVLEASWPREAGREKAELLAVLGDGISPADEIFLERALDDRRSDVRRTAAALLARLPDSGYSRRMAERAASWIGRVGDRPPYGLVVDIPEAPDEAAIRDGITGRTEEFGYRRHGAPDLRAGRLRQLVAALPLDHWIDLFGDPRTAITAATDDRIRQPLFDGWMDATLTRRDPVWAAALFDAGMPSDLAVLRRRELFALLPAEEQTRRLLRLDGSWLSELESLLPAVARPWPRRLANHLLLLLFERARAAERRPDARGVSPGAHRSLLHTATLHLPPAAAAEAAALARRCQDPAWEAVFDRLAHDLELRSTMLQELQ
ncbi:SWIM zinc finger family protein [Nocardia paucivorans]|uniref:SWIM zinc finger family protein n=1 Tax=Nocardia paucivorans TaxID=114259 RepID=UPI0002F4BD15|nr:SWIM zinc finger family protein [Nocardia paucivorans]